MGKIEIKKMEIHGYHGAFTNEQRLKQKFLVSVSFDTDFRKAAESDNLDDTIDYGFVAKLCKERLETPRHLLESIVVDLAINIKTKLPTIGNLLVSIEKPEVQLGLKLSTVKVSHFIQ